METANPRQREFFESRAFTWDETVRHDAGRMDEIVSMLDLRGEDSVLDVGTGTGVMIPLYLSRTRGRIMGVDLANNMIEVARTKFPAERHPRLELVVSDVNDLPLEGEFDAIVCYSCFPHFIDQACTIGHLAEGLGAGGRLMVAHSNSREEINGIHREAGEEVSEDHLPPATTVAGMMEAAGLTVTRTVDDARLYVVIGTRRSSPGA